MRGAARFALEVRLRAHVWFQQVLGIAVGFQLRGALLRFLHRVRQLVGFGVSDGGLTRGERQPALRARVILGGAAHHRVHLNGIA